MHSDSMSFLQSPGICVDSSYKTYCYIPVTSSAAICSNDVSSFRLCLPSSYQGNLWLLDNCQESYGQLPSCESPSCELKTCNASCSPSKVPCISPNVGKVSSSTCAATTTGTSPSCGPKAQSKGYVPDGSSLCKFKAWQISSNGSKCSGQLNYLSKSLQPLNFCRVGNLGYGNYFNLGLRGSSLSPSYSIAYRSQSPSYSMRKSHYGSNYKPLICQPLSYFSRKFRIPNCIASTFPPLRYLCSGCRPLSCY